MVSVDVKHHVYLLTPERLCLKIDRAVGHRNVSQTAGWQRKEDGCPCDNITFEEKGVFPKLRADKSRDDITFEGKGVFPKLLANKGRSMTVRVTTHITFEDKGADAVVDSKRDGVAARFVTMARFVSMPAAMPERFVTSKIVTDKSCRHCTFLTWISVYDIYIIYIYRERERERERVIACVRKREMKRDRQRDNKTEQTRGTERRGG